MSLPTSQLYILKSRLKKPPLPTDLVPRQRLIDQLNQADQYSFTLICAPAGYGKSTLLSSWLEISSQPFVWLNLATDLNDYDLFLSHLSVTFQESYPEAMQQFVSLLHGSQNLPDQYLVAVFCDDLFEIDCSVIIVLDDYYMISNPKIHQFIEGVIENAPDHIHLVMTSRWNPVLPLSRWRARGQMMEIRAEQLLFREEEIRSFFNRTLGDSLSANAVNLIAHKTEGWIACLRLMVLSIQAGNDPESVTRFFQIGSEPYISAYLLDQIYSTLPGDIQLFLEKTSLLNRLNAGLCDALDLECCTESQEILDSLIDSNLFLIPLDQNGNWYRYHNLIKDDLQTRLNRNTSTEEIASLHIKAAEWLARTGNIEEAIQHFMSGGNVNGAVVIIENKLLEIMNTENLRRVERWLKHIPDEIIDRRPMLLLAKALIYTFHLRLGVIHVVLKRIDDILSKRDVYNQLEEPAVVEGLLNTFWSQSKFWSGDWQDAIKHGRSGLEILPKDYSYAQGLCTLYQSVGMKMLGQGDEAIAWLKPVVWGVSEPFSAMTVRSAMALSVIYTELGYLSQALQVSKHLLLKCEQNSLPLGTSWGHYFTGRVYLQQGDYGQALFHFKSVSGASYQAHIGAAHECFLGLATIYQAQGAQKLADSVVDSAEELALGAENQRHLVEINSFRARLALQRGDPETAFRLLQVMFETPLPTFPFIFLELPHLTLARAWIATGEPEYIDKAVALLDQMLEIATTTHNVWREIEFLLVRSLAYQQQGNPANALGDLQQALGYVKKYQFTQMLLELRPSIQTTLGQLNPRLMVDTVLGKYYSDQPTWKGQAPAMPEPSLRDLTEREIEVLELFGRRMAYNEVSQRLVISPLTVKTHARNIYKKLGVNGRREAVALARQIGLLVS